MNYPSMDSTSSKSEDEAENGPSARGLGKVRNRKTAINHLAQYNPAAAAFIRAHDMADMAE